MNTRDVSPHVAFLVISIVFGILFALITPPFQAPDEINHFGRAYQISEGQWMPGGDKNGAQVPEAILATFEPFRPTVSDPADVVTVEEIRQADRIHFDPSKRQPLMVAVYSPLSYIPQAAGILIGRWMGLSVLLTLYLARLLTLAAWIALVFVAIRFLPIGKWAMFVVTLLPMSLWLAASTSADALTNALAALAVSLGLQLRLQKRPVRTSQAVACLAVAVLLTAQKPPYSLLFLIPLLLPGPPARLTRGARRTLWLGLAVCSALVLVWAVSVQSGSVAPDNVSAAGQVARIVSAPDAFAVSLLRTFTGLPALALARQFIGQLGLGAKTPLWAMVVAWGALIASFLAIETRLSSATVRSKMVYAGFVAAVFLLIPTALYVSFHVVGFRSTIWVQGRYFLPIALAAIPLVASRNGAALRVTPFVGRAFIGIQAGLLVTLLWSVLSRYYGI